MKHMGETSVIDVRRLGALLKTKRGGHSLRDVAKDIGEVSASTLSRIELGKVPDLDTFVRICRWLRVSPESLYSTPVAPLPQEALISAFLSTPDFIESKLRAEQVLPERDIEALARMIRMAYSAAEAGSSKAAAIQKQP